MKRLVLLLSVILIAMTMSAGVVTIDEALQKAQDFMARHHSMGTTGKLRLVQQKNALQQAEGQMDCKYYIFNQGTDEGFVIVSADDRTEPILGYADAGTFDEQYIPDNMRQWLRDYTEQIQQLDVCGIEDCLTASAVPTGRQYIQPMLMTRWGQDTPYNNFCPIDSTNAVCLTGCVATAMAQVMNYYRYPSRTTMTIPAYTTETQNIAVPAIARTTIDWDNMLPSYDGVVVNEAQIRAVATLMALCGFSVQMDYGSGASSAPMDEIPKAMIHYFGYDASTRQINRSGITTTQWESIIYGELVEGRPVIYRGNRDTKGKDSGHAFVIDGYDGQGYYHVNWGWTGNYNGFFLLSVLPPYVTSEEESQLSNEGYCLTHQAVIGIRHDGGGKAEALRMTSRSMELTSSTSVSRSSTSNNFPNVSLTMGTYNFTGATNTFDVGVGLLDEQGSLVATKTVVQEYSLDENWGWKALKADFTFGKGLANGTYRIVTISRLSNERSWQLNEYAELHCIYATINGKNMTLRPSTIDLSGSIKLEGQAEALKLSTLNVHIQNNGTAFSNQVYLFIDGERAGGRYIDVETDGTTDFKIGFTPTSAGSYQLSMAYYKDSEYVTFAQLNIKVAEPAYNLLEMKMLASNAKNKTVGSRLWLNISAKNLNTSAYDNKIRANIYKLRHDGSNVGDFVTRCERYVHIAPGATTTTDLLFENLEDGETYFVWIYYFSEGQQDKDNRIYGGQYKVDYATGIEPVITEQPPTVNIYTIGGRLIGQCLRSQLSEQLRALPSGFYVVEGKIAVSY
jgi:hypothetical protein